MPWKPIVTAPRDGSEFLAGNYGSDDMVIVRFADWTLEGGWTNGDYTYDLDHFDCWMLPESPSKESPNYRDLLKKYMKHVQYEEGTNFMPFRGECDGFTDEEIVALEKIENEIWPGCRE